MKKKTTLNEIVTNILAKDVKSRTDTNRLYKKVLQKVNKESLNWTVNDYLLNMNKSNIPSIECVGRTKRNVQSKYLNLR